MFSVPCAIRPYFAFFFFFVGLLPKISISSNRRASRGPVTHWCINGTMTSAWKSIEEETTHLVCNRRVRWLATVLNEIHRTRGNYQVILFSRVCLATIKQWSYAFFEYHVWQCHERFSTHSIRCDGELSVGQTIGSGIELAAQVNNGRLVDLTGWPKQERRRWHPTGFGDVFFFSAKVILRNDDGVEIGHQNQ